MHQQVRELDEGTLHRMSKVAQLSMGEDHARSGGSARVALERGTLAYNIGFAEQVYAEMQTSALWSEKFKLDLGILLDGEQYGAALEMIARERGEL